ncbi:MAG: purine-nucleoside phosphorylase [Erysipelotrichaceae bacterium]|jgi:purine-nucleoside phosphorylase|nr:purine-nucleoside phosphorylase [Erysipelotrichaceae bacterium]
MSTPHNAAEKGMIAKTVLMPGDPLRAKFIADTYLKDVVQFNSIRNMFGYTGTYKGKPVSVMGSGMGMPSIGIYSYELFTQYDVDNIIRLGSAGAYTDKAKVLDVVLVDGAWSESSYAKTCCGYEGDMTYPDKELTEALADCAKELGIPVVRTNTHSSDVFYRVGAAPDYFDDIVNKFGCACVEMESFALFCNAKVTGKKGACILTISDSLVDHIETTAEERQNTFTNMMEIALEFAAKQ